MERDQLTTPTPCDYKFKKEWRGGKYKIRRFTVIEYMSISGIDAYHDIGCEQWTSTRHVQDVLQVETTEDWANNYQ